MKLYCVYCESPKVECAKGNERMLIKICSFFTPISYTPQKYILVSFVCQLNVPVHFASSYILQSEREFWRLIHYERTKCNNVLLQLPHLQRSKSLCATSRIEVLYNRTKIAFVSTALHLSPTPALALPSPHPFFSQLLWCDKMKVEQDYQSEREGERVANGNVSCAPHWASNKWPRTHTHTRTFNCICFSGFKSVKLLGWKLSATSAGTCASESPPQNIRTFSTAFIYFICWFSFVTIELI